MNDDLADKSEFTDCTHIGQFYVPPISKTAYLICFSGVVVHESLILCTTHKSSFICIKLDKFAWVAKVYHYESCDDLRPTETCGKSVAIG